MNILVVGHLCLDVIHSAQGRETRSYGGIYYAVVTLARLMEKGDSVIPVFGVNKNDYQPLMEHLEQFPEVDCSGIFRFDEPTNSVDLYYEEGKEGRTERSTDIAKPIPYSKIRRHLSVDGVLINMISGFDIEIDTLDHIRMAVRSHGIPIHFDFHSLTLGVDEKHIRFRRPLDEWRRWAFMVDTLQMNEEEILGLPRERLTEPQIAGHLLTLGTKAVVVTRGSRGATVFQNEKKQVVRTEIEGIAVPKVVDTTGCGDVFGAAFLQRYVKTHDAVEAAGAANTVSASRIGSDGAASLAGQIPTPPVVAESLARKGG